MEKIIKAIKDLDIGNITPVDCLIFINDIKGVIRDELL